MAFGRPILGFSIAAMLAGSCKAGAAQLSQAQEVYERTINAVFREDVDVRRPSTVYVLNSSDTLAWLPDSSYRARSSDNPGTRLAWGDLPLHLRDSFHQIVGHSSAIEAHDLPPTARLGGDNKSRNILVSLSPIVFTPDSSQALVYVAVHCGGLCGGADIVYLRKASSGWTVAATFPTWRS